MMFNILPFVNVINIHSRDSLLRSPMVDSEKDFQVFVASGTSSSLSPQDVIEVDDRLLRLVYVVEVFLTLQILQSLVEYMQHRSPS